MVGLLIVYGFIAVCVGLYFRLAVENDFETSVKKGVTWPVVFIKTFISGSSD